MATKGQKQFGDTILKEVLVMKEQGKTNREISEYFGFKDKFVIKRLIARYHRKQKNLIQASLFGLKEGLEKTWS